jgi:hypothetical protein
MISIYKGRIRKIGYLPEEISSQCLIYIPYKKVKHRSFTTVSISIFTLTSRTQHRGAKPLHR